MQYWLVMKGTSFKDYEMNKNHETHRPYLLFKEKKLATQKAQALTDEYGLPSIIFGVIQTIFPKNQEEENLKEIEPKRKKRGRPCKNKNFS